MIIALPMLIGLAVTVALIRRHNLRRRAMAVTDGMSRVRFDPAGISLIPSVGWGPIPFKANPDSMICSPSLMRRDGTISALLMSKSGATLEAQVADFLQKQKPVNAEQREFTAASGLRGLHVAALMDSEVKGERVQTLAPFYFLMNGSGRVVVVYSVGSIEVVESFITWFEATVQLEQLQ